MNELTIAHYLTELGNKDGLPGGGSAGAYIGAMSASLVRLVVDVQKDKKSYADYSDELYSLLKQAHDLRDTFERLASDDSKAFEPVLKAYQMPKETAEDKEKRQETIEAALLKAAQPPMDMLQSSRELIRILEQLVKMRMQGTIVNDLMVAAVFMRAVLETAHLNVTINTKLMKNEQKREEMNRQADEWLAQGMSSLTHLSEVMTHFLTHNQWSQALMEEE